MVAFWFKYKTIVLSILNLPLVLSLVPTLPGHLISRQNRQLCNESEEWSPTPEAWVAASTDERLAEWWASISQDRARFDASLGTLLGYTSAKCGIGSSSSCPLPSCFGAENGGAEPWTYLAAVSMQNLNTMFNVMYDGLALAQTDAQALADDLADNFFDWKDPLYLAAAIAYALEATISSIISFGVLRIPVPVIRGGLRGVQIFGSAATDASLQLFQPLQGQTRTSGIRELHTMFYSFSNAARNALDDLAFNVFAGKQDLNNNTILDYLQAGSFLDASLIPQQTDVENFYKTTLVARVANAGWREKSIYMISTTADIKSLHDYPEEESYHSPKTKRTYTPYYYKKKKVKAPPGIQSLNNTLYNINSSQIAESSARAWEFAGNNCTHETALKRLQGSLLSKGALTPFQDGAGWEGVFTLPVCDIGNRPKWVVEYNQKVLPCCCGVKCKDTKRFLKLAHLDKSQSFYKACKKQLKGTDLDFNSIDYGHGDQIPPPLTSTLDVPPPPPTAT